MLHVYFLQTIKLTSDGVVFVNGEEKTEPAVKFTNGMIITKALYELVRFHYYN